VLVQVGTGVEARAALDAGCEGLIAQGVEAGGHLRGERSAQEVLAEVREVAGREVPVLVAGGYSYPAALGDARATGADGILTGSAFIDTCESLAHARYKQSVREAGAGDTVVTERFDIGWHGRPHRVLASCLEAFDPIRHGHAIGKQSYGGRTSILFAGSVSVPTQETQAPVEMMAHYCGVKRGARHATTRSAGEVVQELAKGE
jgi:nitronate monooxygenase